MGVSVSVQRISTLAMKVLGIISLVLVCVAARGSGPYLPRGWKPEGPSFYLPSEASKPFKEPVKEVIFSESEASGSDFLREYGPPKIEEVSQDVSQQALPDVINTQLFIETAVENTDAKQETYRASEVTDQKVEVTAEVKATEGTLSITESQSVTAKESVANTEVDTIQVNDETTTSTDAVESGNVVDKFGYHLVESTESIANTEVDNTKVNDETTTLASTIGSGNAVKEFGYHLVEPTIAVSVTATESIPNTEVDNTKVNDEIPTSAIAVGSGNAFEEFLHLVESTVPVEIQTEKVIIETNNQLQNQILGGVTYETQQLIGENQELVQLAQVEQYEITPSIQVTKEVEQSSSEATQHTEPSKEESSDTTITQQANLDIITTVEEKVKKTEEDLKKTEKIVENISELIVSLENDVKSQQTEIIEEVPVIVQELFGTLDQAPEGFLEYGPPGFTEYGPPKEDLRGNTIEENISENSEIRRRRFSPKLRSSRKSQQ